MNTIMLVDDSATTLLSLSNILLKGGYAVEKTCNAAAGLARFKDGLKVDLLITDLNMPGMNGIEFIKEVRSLPDYQAMPILCLTTESQHSRRAEAKAVGASGCLVKPTKADELLNTIRRTILKWRFRADQNSIRLRPPLVAADAEKDLTSRIAAEFLSTGCRQ